MSDTDPIQAYTDYSVTEKKLVYLQEENPTVKLGEEKPYKPPQQDKKP